MSQLRQPLQDALPLLRRLRRDASSSSCNTRASSPLRTMQSSSTSEWGVDLEIRRTSPRPIDHRWDRSRNIVFGGNPQRPSTKDFTWSSQDGIVFASKPQARHYSSRKRPSATSMNRVSRPEGQVRNKNSGDPNFFMRGGGPDMREMERRLSEAKRTIDELDSRMRIVNKENEDLRKELARKDTARIESERDWLKRRLKESEEKIEAMQKEHLQEKEDLVQRHEVQSRDVIANLRLSKDEAMAAALRKHWEEVDRQKQLRQEQTEKYRREQQEMKEEFEIPYIEHRRRAEEEAAEAVKQTLHLRADERGTYVAYKNLWNDLAYSVNSARQNVSRVYAPMLDESASQWEMTLKSCEKAAPAYEAILSLVRAKLDEAQIAKDDRRKAVETMVSAMKAFKTQGHCSRQLTHSLRYSDGHGVSNISRVLDEIYVAKWRELVRSARTPDSAFRDTSKSAFISSLDVELASKSRSGKSLTPEVVIFAIFVARNRLQVLRTLCAETESVKISYVASNSDSQAMQELELRYRNLRDSLNSEAWSEARQSSFNSIPLTLSGYRDLQTSLENDVKDRLYLEDLVGETADRGEELQEADKFLGLAEKEAFRKLAGRIELYRTHPGDAGPKTPARTMVPRRSRARKSSSKDSPSIYTPGASSTKGSAAIDSSSKEPRSERSQSKKPKLKKTQSKESKAKKSMSKEPRSKDPDLKESKLIRPRPKGLKSKETQSNGSQPYQLQLNEPLLEEHQSMKSSAKVTQSEVASSKSSMPRSTSRESSAAETPGVEPSSSVSSSVESTIPKPLLIRKRNFFESKDRSVPSRAVDSTVSKPPLTTEYGTSPEDLGVRHRVVGTTVSKPSSIKKPAVEESTVSKPSINQEFGIVPDELGLPYLETQSTASNGPSQTDGTQPSAVRYKRVSAKSPRASQESSKVGQWTMLKSWDKSRPTARGTRSFHHSASTPNSGIEPFGRVNNAPSHSHMPDAVICCFSRPETSTSDTDSYTCSTSKSELGQKDRSAPGSSVEDCKNEEEFIEALDQQTDWTDDVSPAYSISAEDLRKAAMSSPNSLAAFWSYKLYKNSEGKCPVIYYCTNAEQAEIRLQEIGNEPILGFDIEWEMGASTTKHSIQSNVSLVQLASESKIVLVHLGVFKGSTPEEIVPPTLRKIIESADIAKAGVNIRGDASRIRACLQIEMRGIFELSHLYRVVNYGNTRPDQVNFRLVSLADQVKNTLLLPLKKDEVRTSRWSKKIDMQQSEYAASDAYAGYQLFQALEAQRREMVPMPPCPAFFEDRKPLVLGDGTEVHHSASATKITVRKKPNTPSVEVAAVVEDDDEVEEFFDAEEYPDQTLSTQPAAISVAGVLLAGLSPTSSSSSSNTSSAQSHSSSATSKPITPRAPPPSSKELTLADEWIQTFRASLEPEYPLRARDAQLRSYHLWHTQRLDCPSVAAVLRDPPLASSTVATYILEALKLENLPYDDARLRDGQVGPVAFMPPAALGRYARVLNRRARN